jgi:hypothetical protein
VEVKVEKRAPASFLAVNGVFTAAAYPLKNSLIINLGTTLYIFNEIVRFYNFRYALTNDYVYARDTTIPILGYSEVDFELVYNGRTKLLRLKDIAFCEAFAYNLISLRQLYKQGI